MAIPLSNIVKVNPGVLAATGSAVDLNGLILTDSEYAPSGQVITFTSDDDVATYFGSASTEASMATVYFKGYDNASQTPGKLLFARYNSAPIAAFLRSGSLSGMSLTDLKLLSGILTLTIDSVSVTTANIDFSGVTSFDDAAVSIENAINAVNSSAQVTVSWDTTTKAFILTSSTTGVASTLTYATGTLSAGIKLTSATGAVLSQGANTAVVSDLFTVILSQSQEWACFTTSFMPDEDEALAFGSWANDQDFRFVYVLIDNSGEALNSGSTETLAYPMVSGNFNGTVPAYGVQSYAANVLGYAASLNFDLQNGRRPLAFRTLSGLLPYVDNNEDYSALIANGYSFYGRYAANNVSTDIWYNGAITGAYKWLDAFLGQIWLNANLQGDIINLFKSEVFLPYNASGKAAIEASMTARLEQFKTWGGLSTGTTLDANQITAIKNTVGSDVSTTLTSKGYYVYIGPFTATMRSNRTTPVVYVWYCDGGFIQKLTVNSVEVQ